MMTLRRQKSRRTQLERRNETQAAILSAAINLLVEHGYAGFSASRVAARAGVSRGAQEHYFPKKNDLIAAATRYAMREAVEHAQLLARTASESTDPVAKFLKDSEHFFFRPVYRALIEIMIAARSDRALARVLNPIVLDARQTLNGIWIDTLGAAGYPRKNAQRFIELTHFLRAVFSLSPHGCRTASIELKSSKPGAGSRPPCSSQTGQRTAAAVLACARSLRCNRSG